MTNAERDLQHALERTFSGDMSVESGCVMDALEDLGWQLTPVPVRGEQPEPASTKPLAKRRTA
jgi:hypothetical protein